MTIDAVSVSKATRRGTRTRDALLAAGHRLLAERPIDALAVDDIVQAAGVAKGSFYNHFGDKEALASTIRDDIRQAIEAAIAAVNAEIEDPGCRVVRALAVYMNYVLATRQRASLTLRIASGLASTHNPMNAGVRHDITEGLRSGRFIVPSVEAGALFVSGICHIMLMHAVEEPIRATNITVAQQLGALVLRGLGLPFQEAESLSAHAMHELVIHSAVSS